MKDINNSFLLLDDKNKSLYSIPVGFTLHSETVNLDYSSAEKIMKSKKSRRITCAKKNNDLICIQKHYFICPNCGNRITAYEWYFSDKSVCPEKQSKKVIEKFCDNQLSLFEETGRQCIYFNKPLQKVDKIQCPHYSCTDYISEDYRKCSVSYNDHIMQISCELNIKDLFEITWIKDVLVKFSDISPREVLEFDFLSGNITVVLFDGNNRLFSCQVSSFDSFGRCDPCLLLFKNVLIRRKIKKVYKEITSYKCPFEEDEINPDNTMLMTKFVGYNRTFYDAIPFSYGNSICENHIDISFESISTIMHNSSDIPNLYIALLLPKCKSVKKVFMEKPEFLFYYKEFESLWKIVNDPNHFYRLMQCNLIFSMVSFIHKYENVIEYYTMLKEVKGIAWLCKHLEHDNSLYSDFCNEALEYCAMNESEKELIKQSYLCRTYQRRSFSVPMPTLQSSIPDCYIDGFRFFWLKSTIDFYHTGSALHNCLTGYSPDNNPVVAVQKDKCYVAAIEVDMRTNEVFQAYAKNNTDICQNPKLEIAFKKWCKKFNLTINEL